jgi:hypothetical protein
MGRFSTVDFETIGCIDCSVTKLLKSIQYTADDGSVYECPQYQPTDFASTPKATWGLPLFLIPTGWWAIPAIFHDAGFQNTLLKVLPDGAREKAFPNAMDEHQVNDLLLEMMKAIKPIPNLFELSQMKAIYEGVTIGGWHAWKKDRS